MKRLVLCSLSLAIGFAAQSQKVYFVYLQTEVARPFFVKMNEKLFNSTPAGYLILSNLKDTIYDFSIGFPQNKIADQDFSIKVDKKDHGYLFKNFAEKGWGLYDLESSSVQMSLTPIVEVNAKKKEQNSSAFTDILSKAADDPTLKEKVVQLKAEEKEPEVVPQEIVKIKEKKPVVIEHSSKKDEPKEEIKNEEIKTISSETYKRSIVTRKSESSNIEGFGLTYTDEFENGTKDTIRILIPNSKSSTETVKPEIKEKKFLDIIPDTSDKTNLIIVNSIRDPLLIKSDSIQSNTTNNCIEIASEEDFGLLRKKMLAEKNDSIMIAEALKNFRTKCFTSAQLKNLSTLFLKDENKYKFFDAAYSYVSDSANFILLKSELKDVYYINKFNAMLH